MNEHRRRVEAALTRWGRRDVREIEKNDIEHIRVGWAEYKGRRYLSARLWYQDDGGEWRPTKRGLTLDADLWREVVEALRAELGEA
jgi:hypothetical protein